MADEVITENQNTQETSDTPPPQTQTQPELTDAQRQALTLHESLNDPDLAPAVIEGLARKFGLKIEKGEKPAAAAEDLIARMKSKTHKDLHFLIDGLTPAFEELAKEQAEKHVAPVRQTVEQSQRAIVERESSDAISTMKSRHKDFDKHESAILELAKDMPMRPGSNMVSYLERLYTLATADQRTTTEVSRTVERINRNSQEAQVASAETAGTTKTGPKFPTIDEAVDAAARNERLI